MQVDESAQARIDIESNEMIDDTTSMIVGDNNASNQNDTAMRNDTAAGKRWRERCLAQALPKPNAKRPETAHHPAQDQERRRMTNRPTQKE